MNVVFKIFRKLYCFVVLSSKQLHSHLWIALRGQFFVSYSNFIFVLGRRDVRFKKSEISEAKFIATNCSGDLVQYFSHVMQAVVVYSGGLEERANKISSDYMLSQIEFTDGDKVIDCGCNVGDLSLYFRVNSLKVGITAFEPSRREYQCARLNQVEHDVINTGLWSEDATLEFYVSSQEADSSFLQPKTFDEIISIPVQAGSRYARNRVKLLKLEAEGAEPEILLGFSETLSNIEYIAADVGFERGKKAESTIIPVVNYLLQRDFEIVDINFERLCVLFRNKNLIS